ncbi:MAG: tail fiber protein [Roseomonas sp.]|nr:tail fiber protein [Roseomonas sp.]
MYAISWSTGFEIGLGDFDGGSPGSLTRATVLASSNSGALVTLPAGTKDVFAVFDPAAREVVSITATATLALADLGNTVVFTGASAATLNLPAVASAPLGSGWLIRNAGTAALTIDPNAAETINGLSVLVLPAGMTAEVLRNGSAWTAMIHGFGRMVGEYVPLAAGTLPPLCVWPNGQNLSRSSYSALFGALGTTYGAGDGSTTFGTPDIRGRGLFALDNLGGTAANRITSGVSGIAGATLGAAGGDERIGTHGHTSTAHNHGINDPGHVHAVRTGGDGSYGGGANGGVDLVNPFIFRGENTQAATTGITINNATVTINDFAGGAAANMPPAMMAAYALFAGA